MPESPIQTTLPTGRLIAANVIAALLGAGLGWGGAMALAEAPSAGPQTALGAGIAGVISVVLTVVIRPGQERPIFAAAMTLLAAGMGRLVAAIGGCVLLYFAAQIPAAPLLSGTLLTLLFVLFFEARIATSIFRRLTPPAGDSPTPSDTNTDEPDC